MAAERATLIIPVESQVRELDAKILLSAIAAERGFPVIMGSRAFIHHQMASFPRGVYLAKSMRDKSERMFDIIRKLGHHIVAWDEEGLARFPDRFYYQRRLSAKTLSDVNLLVCWGEDNARAFRAFDGCPECPIEVTGNPRIDLLRPELRGVFSADAEELRERFGDFVLLNTNFSGLNHFYEELSELRLHLEPKGGEVKDEFMAGRAAFRNVIYEHFLEMIPRISDFLANQSRPAQLIVRPHPSESHEVWKSLTRDLPNAQVVHEGNVYPWLMASRALLHNGCTTAVEAAVLGVPTVAYQPATDDVYDLTLPNSVSHSAHNLDELEVLLGRILDGNESASMNPEQRKILGQHVEALDGPLAAERIVEAIERAGYAEGPPAPQSPLNRLSARVHLWGRTWVKRINSQRPGHRNNLDFHRHRFPGVDADEIRDRIGLYARTLGRFDDLKVSEISDFIFRIER